MKNIIAAVSQKGLKDLSKTKNANHLLTTVLSRREAGEARVLPLGTGKQDVAGQSGLVSALHC